MFAQNTQTAPVADLETKPYTEVTIDVLGKASIEGKNFVGSACSLMGDALRRRISGPDDTSTPKPAMYDTEDQNQTQDW